MYNIRVCCKKCNSSHMKEVSRESIKTAKRFTDHIIMYRCLDCGQELTIGKSTGGIAHDPQPTSRATVDNRS